MGMRWKVDVIGREKLLKRLESIPLGVQNALMETMEDLRRCALGFAPKDTGHLESSGRVEIRKTKNTIVGSVTYEVTADSYNYAIKMHEGFYNLGDGSRAKSGGTSKFGVVKHTVGRKYLEEPFKQLLPAYVTHIGEVIERTINT